MDLLKAEIERKRKAVELAKSSKEVGRVGGPQSASASGGGGGGGRQYLKASDLRRFQERQEELEEERRRRPRKGGAEGARKRRRYGSAESSGGSGGESGGSDGGDGAVAKPPEKTDPGKGDGARDDASDEDSDVAAQESLRKHDESLSPAEVTKSLRELGLPVRLFGERTVRLEDGTNDDARRLDRLHQARESRRAAMAGMSEMDEFRLGGAHDIRNPFLGGKKRGGGTDDGGGEEGAVKRAKLGAVAGGKSDSAAKAARKLVELSRRGENQGGDRKGHEDEDDPHKRIYRFFKNLLKQWEDELARRPESVRRTAAGRNDTKTVKQCKDYIRPLFKLCKKRTLESGMMAHIVKIVDNCEEGEFVKAHDAYIDLAIGRAAWPMGVTMVGIHARSGREKISSSNVAHVMNSELQRKYLTSVKRLMSYYQKKRTDVDPSKKVLNM